MDLHIGGEQSNDSIVTPNRLKAGFLFLTPRRGGTGMPHMPEKAPSFWVLVLTALMENSLAIVLTFALS